MQFSFTHTKHDDGRGEVEHFFNLHSDAQSSNYYDRHLPLVEEVRNWLKTEAPTSAGVKWKMTGFSYNHTQFTIWDDQLAMLFKLRFVV